jgi:small-conductance mechanosensitive channel
MAGTFPSAAVRLIVAATPAHHPPASIVFPYPSSRLVSHADGRIAAEEEFDMLSDFWTHFGAAVIRLAIAFGIGFIADQLLFRALNSRFARSGWKPGVTIAEGLHWSGTCFGLVVGAGLAVQELDLVAETDKIAMQGVTIAGILVITAFSARILGRVVRVYTERENTRLPSSSIFVNLARGIVWALGATSVLAALGVSIAPIITALGVGGLAVGLALQPTLENAFSGVQMLASRQIEPGDFIRLDTGEEGTVLDVTWRNTTIQRVSGEMIIVPNAVIGRALITNFSAGAHEYGLAIPVTVEFTTDLDTIERLAFECATEVIADTEGAVRGSQPTVRFVDLTPPTVTFNTVIQVTSYAERVPVRSEFVRRLQRRFAEEGVQAPPVVGGTAKPPA